MTQVDDEGFIKWDGGEMPVPKGTVVHVKYREGEESTVTAGLWPHEEGYWELEDKNVAARWNHEGNCQDIVAYKLYKEPRNPPVVPSEPVSMIKGVKVEGKIEEVLYAAMAILHDDYLLEDTVYSSYASTAVTLEALVEYIDDTKVVKVSDIEKKKLDKEIEEAENKLNELKSKRGEMK